MYIRRRFCHPDSILSLLPDPMTRFDMTPLSSGESMATTPTAGPVERARNTPSVKEREPEANLPGPEP